MACISAELFELERQRNKRVGALIELMTVFKSLDHQQTMAGSHGGHGSHPIHMHPVRPLYRYSATLLGASMWFFLMYRAKKDGPVLLGWRHPWDH